jgi:hypothetical protein
MNTLTFTVAGQLRLMGTMTGIVTENTQSGPVVSLDQQTMPPPLWAEVAARAGIAPEVALAVAAGLALVAAFLLRAGISVAVRRAIERTGRGAPSAERIALFEREATLLTFGTGTFVGLLLFGGMLPAVLCGGAFVLIGLGSVHDAVR